MNNLELIRLIAYTDLLLSNELGNEGKKTLKALLSKLEEALKNGERLC